MSQEFKTVSGRTFLSKRRRASIWSGGKGVELDFSLVTRVKEGINVQMQQSFYLHQHYTLSEE